MTHNRWAWRLLALIATACSLGCNETPVLVHYELPNDYRGPLVIATRCPDGQVLEQDSRGRFRVVVPASGVVKVKGDGPFYCLTKSTASYRDGRHVLVNPPPDLINDKTVHLRVLFSRSDQTIWY